MNQLLQIGKTLYSRYKIIRTLGSGGFGDTYLAIDLGLPGQPQCVVKHLKPKDLNPAVFPIAKSLFEREAQILYQLGNDNDQIPRLFAHFEENGDFYLVQEFVDGHDLTAEIIPGQPTTETEVIQLLKDILAVLVFVHQHNVIHRDIKPQNLMRRHKDGKIVLIDFGAVKEVGVLGVNAQGQTSVTVAIGSPGYMPSEQAKGKPKLCSDIYAVGMIGIQALTGFMPHQLQEDPTTGEVSWQNLVKVNNQLADILNKMVRDNFSQRYQSATEALQALNAIVISPPLQYSQSRPKNSRVFFNLYIALSSIITLVILTAFGTAFFDKQPQNYETWRYSQFIQEVEKGRVEKVSLSQDRSKALVTPKYDVKKKLVTLANDPELINILTSKDVDISVLPPVSILPEFNSNNARNFMIYGELIRRINKGQVKKVELNESQKIANVYLKEQKPNTPPIMVRLLENNQELIRKLKENNVDFDAVK